MNYGELKTHIRGECVVEFSNDLFDRWQDIVRKWLRRDHVLNDLQVSGSVTPTSNPFALSSEDVEEITSIWWSDGTYQYPMRAVSAELFRRWSGQPGVDPTYYIRVGNQVEVAPGLSDKTFYYIATLRDSAMTVDTDQSTALDMAPGLVVQAFLRLAHRHNQDYEKALIADQDYATELVAYREHELNKQASTAAEMSGAWTWMN